MRRLAGLVCFLAATAAVDASEPPLSVSLVIPSDGAVARVVVSDPKAHFHVLLRNTSATPLRVWDTTFSWGYYSLSLELVDQNGVRHAVRKRRIAFTRNMPRAWLLEPDGYSVLDVFLGRVREWEGLPAIVSGCETVQMTAVYEVTADPESRNQGVWTGHVASTARSVSLCK